MAKEHHYKTLVQWTGNTGSGTDHYRNYERSHRISIEGKAAIEASSDPAFRGDPSLHNPEELFLASLSSCHMLWYLHFCAVEGVVVTRYEDRAEGKMNEEKSGKGRFTEVVLHPKVTVTESIMKSRARELHQKAHEYCFIANSCDVPIRHEALIECEKD